MASTLSSSEKAGAFEESDRNLEARKQIDEQIRRLRKQILELCSARNRLTPIALLPVEVLTGIFLLVRDTTVVGRSYTSLDLSWVCREWRTIALRLPRLWNLIDSLHPNLVKAFLERSIEVELGFCLTNLQTKNASAIAAAIESFPRLYSLRLDFQVPGLYIRCKSTWEVPAPLLEKLQLTGFALSDNIFSGVYPSLYELSLTNCEATMNQLPISPHLTILHIISPYSLLPVADFVNILRSLPNIKCLELSEALFFRSSARLGNQPRVPLPKMQSFTLNLEACGAAVALCYGLSLPSNTRISLKLQFKEDDDFSHTVLAVQESRLQPAWEINSLSIQVGDRRLLCSYTEVDTLRLGDTSTTIEFDIAPENENCPNAQDVMDVCYSLQLDYVQQLTIEGKLEYEAGLWQHALGTLPNLSALIVRDQSAGQFVRYLKEEAERLVSAEQTTNLLVPPQHQPTFRRLQSLTLRDLRQTAPDYVDISLLLWALGPRKIYLERLPKLVLEGAQLPDEILASFIHVVDKISQEPVPAPVEEEDGVEEVANGEDED